MINAQKRAITMFEDALNELEKQGLIVLMCDSVTCVHYREDFYAESQHQV